MEAQVENNIKHKQLIYKFKFKEKKKKNIVQTSITEKLRTWRNIGKKELTIT